MCQLGKVRSTGDIPGRNACADNDLSTTYDQVVQNLLADPANPWRRVSWGMLAAQRPWGGSPRWNPVGR